MVLLCIFAGFAQITDMGGPLVWNGNADPLHPLEFEIMDDFNLEAMQAEDEINDVKGDGPWRFGYKYETNYTSSNSGKWTTLSTGDRVWQLGITCVDAQTINFIFEDFNLPDGAYIYLYDSENTNRVGAYTSRNNRMDGLLGTELVHGENVIIEYFEPAEVYGEGSFTISNVIHGYRSLNRVQEDLMRGVNDSGNCNVDVNCPLGDDWGDQIRSVAMIVVGGNGICTGALINNTCEDGEPFFLTADHCLGGSTGSWAFRFNWESPPGTESCATTAGSSNPGPPYDQTANGATILENDGISDFALLEIDLMTVTDAEDWGCYYAGWDNSDDEAAVDFAIGIHHPSGDLKKICKENEAPYHATTWGAQVWWIDDWDEGVTEPGSSGSPLFNQEGLIIGQLFGGAAACAGTDDNDAYDFYGRFGVSWTNGVSGRLAPASCGSEPETLIGFDPANPCASVSIEATSTTEPSAGGNGSIDIDVTGGTPPYTFDWTGPGGFTASTEDLTDLDAGVYSVTITDDNGCILEVTDITVINNLSLNGSEITTIEAFPNPTDGILNIRIEENWENASYEVIDITGRNIVQESFFQSSVTTIDMTSLAEGIYYIRVKQGSQAKIIPITLTK